MVRTRTLWISWLTVAALVLPAGLALAQEDAGGMGPTFNDGDVYRAIKLSVGPGAHFHIDLHTFKMLSHFPHIRKEPYTILLGLYCKTRHAL